MRNNQKKKGLLASLEIDKIFNEIQKKTFIFIYSIDSFPTLHHFYPPIIIFISVQSILVERNAIIAYRIDSKLSFRFDQI